MVTVKRVTIGSVGGGRPRVRVTGPLRRVRASAHGSAPALRAELCTGDGGVTIIWLGRDRIPGIEPGRVVAVEGMLSRQRGRDVIYNPRYELMPQQRPGRLPGCARPV